MSIQALMFRYSAGKGDQKRDASLKEPAGVTAVRDLDYWGDGNRYHLLDVYYPKGTASPLPVIVSVHGGGYVYGTKEIYKFYCMYLAEQGFTVVNFNYPLAPKHKFPAHLNCINRVMTWMTEHAAEYCMDLDSVFMVGDSAGAQMTSQYAAIFTNPAYEALFPFHCPRGIRLRAVGLNCGMYVREAGVPLKGVARDYYGKSLEPYGPMMDTLGHITAEYPPAYVMTSYYDFLKDKAEPMYRFLKSKGIETEWKCYGEEGQKYMGHVCHVNMNLQEAREINNDELAFFRRFLG